MKLEIKIIVDVDPLPEEGFCYCLDQVEVGGFSEAIKDLTYWELPDAVWAASTLLLDTINSGDESGKVSEVTPPLPGHDYMLGEAVADALRWAADPTTEVVTSATVLAYVQGCLNVRRPDAADQLLRLRMMCDDIREFKI